MIIENSYRSIPKSLQACCQQDYVCDRLWQWSKVIQILGAVCSGLLAVAGLFTGASVASVAYNGFTAFLGTFGLFLLYAGLVWLSTYVSALVIAGFATLVHSNNISSNVALYTASKTETVEQGDGSRSKGWTCKCGTINNVSSMHCKDCGEYKN